jgi:hypothetical protein
MTELERFDHALEMRRIYPQMPAKELIMLYIHVDL